ncbi:Xylose operon regulatory protein [Posidoniimonas polymericola]|uniref:Xylose operon regulatory protein n=1 Tax=Posidoniimonas polymericola TaxID=2528002 RepID=A0A5C5YL74_9BACT|nr:DNA-binding transcriptional regulator [Posidoniimonas polymericola]TWT75660.1 Xylose operon regulatory protein [Posidoniimonas polymericola]
MSLPPQVALLIETARGYGRDVATGIARYAALHGPWSFHLTPGDFTQAAPLWEYWRGHGIFARLASGEISKQLLDADLPTVALDMEDSQLEKSNPLSKFSNLSVDSRQAATLAAEHLIERDFEHFAFVGASGVVWSDRREAAFVKRIRGEGYETHVYDPQHVAAIGRWEREMPRLAEWIGSLPKPIGIMACNDEHGLHVLDACRRSGASVPEEVAVVGVDNDSLLCGLCSPSLSSVVLNGVEGGYQAAAHLDKMMKKGRNQPRRINVSALRVETRQSTDLVSVGNKHVALAMAHIQRSRGSRINADLVAEHCGMSRRELDKLFRDSTGKSIAVEIQNMRLDHARRLLEETDHPVPVIADVAGYSSASYMVQVFRRELQTTPNRYRSKVRSLSMASIKEH